jgi:hypothetical protein
VLDEMGQAALVLVLEDRPGLDREAEETRFSGRPFLRM